MGRRSGPTEGQVAGRCEQHFPAIESHRIPQGQLATPAGFNGAIDAYIPPLDAQLGFTASAHKALVLEELVEFQG